MVSFALLNVVVMKLSWMKHFDQGRRCIKRESHGFWTVLYDAREDPQRRNRFILPRNASQVFFINSEQEPGRKVVILHEPRSRRVLGHMDQSFLGVGGTEMALETPLEFIDEQSGQARGALELVPNEQVDEINATLGMAVDEEVFEDTQFVEELDTALMGT